MANIVIAYIFWLTGGWLGLHHFYLGRDRQAFVWWATFGGGFGLGWLRDLCKLPEYVFDANNNERFINELKHRLINHPQPPLGTFRFGGEILMGFIFAMLVRSLFPVEIAEEGLGRLLSLLLSPIGSAIGVHLVANIGREKAGMKYPLTGSYIGIIVTQNAMFSSLAAAVLLNWKGKEWRAEPYKRRNICKRAFVLTLCGCIYLSMWAGAIYSNAYITTKDGEVVPLREAIHNFFKSPAWSETKEAMNNLYQSYKVHGFSGIWEQVMMTQEERRIANAYKVLGLSDDATQKEITKRYKELAKKWHPDKQKDPTKKQAAAEKFIKIQEAYEILKNMKAEKNAGFEQSKGKHRESDEL